MYKRLYILVCFLEKIGKSLLQKLTALEDKLKEKEDKPIFQNGEIWYWNKWGCPDCGGKEVYEGPCGGLSMNFCCANPTCQHAFNHMGVLGLERIPNTHFLPIFKENFGQWKEN